MKVVFVKRFFVLITREGRWPHQLFLFLSVMLTPKYINTKTTSPPVLRGQQAQPKERLARRVEDGVGLRVRDPLFPGDKRLLAHGASVRSLRYGRPFRRPTGM